eukprot:scaffold25782_cov112-Isochrysis_galbana.AAC.1
MEGAPTKSASRQAAAAGAGVGALAEGLGGQSGLSVSGLFPPCAVGGALPAAPTPLICAPTPSPQPHAHAAVCGCLHGASAVPAVTTSASRRPATTHCAHGCGRNYHAACIRRWALAHGALPALRCPACRACWWQADPCLPTAAELGQEHAGTEEEAVGGAARQEGYLNLGRLLPGGGRVRDTSTYSEWLQVHQRRREQELMITGASGGGGGASAERPAAGAGTPGGGTSARGRSRRAGRGQTGGRGRGRSSSPAASALGGWLRRTGGGQAAP